MPRTSAAIASKDERVGARITADCKRLLIATANHLGVGESAVVEMAIRAFARQNGVAIPAQPDRTTETTAEYKTDRPTDEPGRGEGQG